MRYGHQALPWKDRKGRPACLICGRRVLPAGPGQVRHRRDLPPCRCGCRWLAHTHHHENYYCGRCDGTAGRPRCDGYRARPRWPAYLLRG